MLWESVACAVWRDIRLGVHVLWHAPVVTLVVVASLALGIGATTTIFSVMDSFLLRPLPVREPNRLALVSGGGKYSYWTNLTWEAIRDHEGLFDGAVAFASTYPGDDRFSLTSNGRTEKVDGLWVSGRFFEVLGVPPFLGRTLRESDDRRGGADGAVAVISYLFWQQHFGGSADVIGRSLTIERVPFTVVGVTPPGFFGLDVGRRFDVIVPIAAEALMFGQQSRLDYRAYTWLTIVGRLAPGQTLAAATSALRSAQPQIRKATQPNNPRLAAEHLARPLTLRSAARGPASLLRSNYRQPLALLMGAVALVLLVACANVANLLLARAITRHHELSVRRALGASTARLARQMLAESLLLSGAGAVLGLLLARWGGALLVGQMSSVTSTVFLDFPLDWRVLGFTVAMAVVTTTLAGVVPACRTRRVQPIDAMKVAGRGAVPGGQRSLGQALVVGQIALALVLVVGAGLFVRTFAALATRNIGFDRHRVLVFTADAQRSASGGQIV